MTSPVHIPECQKTDHDLSDSPGNANFTVTTKAGNIPYSVIKGETDKLGALTRWNRTEISGQYLCNKPILGSKSVLQKRHNQSGCSEMHQPDMTSLTGLYVMGRVGTDLTSRDAASS
jgi:hypothetical protein